MLAIHNSPGSFSERWIKYCKSSQIPFRVVNCYDSDIVKQIEDCEILMWHFYHASPKDSLFAKQLLYSLEQSGKIVFPDFRTVWHFDDKVGQKYLFDSLKIPFVDTCVFYERDSALKWVETIEYPLVFKLRGGAGSVNVKKVDSVLQAKRLIYQAFSKGFKHDSLIPAIELFGRYRRNSITLLALFKGLIRRLWPTPYARIHGKEIGYILFQKFIPDNDHDIRVIVIGDKAFAIKRMVRQNDFRASGSGSIKYDKCLFDNEIIKLSFALSEKLKMQCVAFDYVQYKGNPLVVEISYGFSPSGYDLCPGYWDKDLIWHEGKFNPYGWMVENLIEQKRMVKRSKV
jgi:glutathione synthase/RimK-type ligase-like ATP-grasp enzyme